MQKGLLGRASTPSHCYVKKEIWLIMGAKGRVAVVTGAAKGIGFAIAEQFAKEGYKVALLDIDYALVEKSAQALRDAGAKAIALKCDVSDIDEIAKAVSDVAAHYETIDVLVNNAGIAYTTPIEEVTGEEWDEVMAVNLKSMFFMIQKTLPFLKIARSPRIINISSVAGRTGGFETGISYSASKGGVIGLTKGFARQLTEYKITVNTVCPGTIETDIFRHWSDEKKNAILQRNPSGRFGAPEEIATAVSYLASEEAAYITGTTMDINGGSYIG